MKSFFDMFQCGFVILNHKLNVFFLCVQPVELVFSFLFWVLNPSEMGTKILI